MGAQHMGCKVIICKIISKINFENVYEIKGKVFYVQQPPEESLLPPFVGSIINYFEVSNGQLLVAVDHSQLRTMASEIVDPIHCPLNTHHLQIQATNQSAIGQEPNSVSPALEETA